MSDASQPGIELAPLPRDRVGPFLTLGVSKDADAESIERHWAQCVLWARQGKTRTSLSDIHWAREVLRDPERRVEADIDSLNSDTATDELRRIARQFYLDPPNAAWEPVDQDVSAIANLPDPERERERLPGPDVPTDFPAVEQWLKDWTARNIDPWSVPLTTATVERNELHE